MVFKRMLGAFGVGGPSVDTVLAGSRVRPGEFLRGEVRLKGGDFDADIQHITLTLVTRAEAEYGDSEHTGLAEFLRVPVTGPFRLAAKEERAIPFQFQVPWETPITEIHGQPLYGMTMGVRTEVAIAAAVDKGDLDPIAVLPLPSQEAVLEAFARLGFRFKNADVEMGGIYGVHQQLPFYQEIEFFASPQHAAYVNEVELTFVADPGGMHIVLEADHRGHGDDTFGRWYVGHEEALHRDWAAEINGWLTALSQYGHGGFHGAPYGPHGDPYGHGHHGHPGHHGHHGSGTGAAIVAGAAGLAAGFIAAEAIDEIGDFFEGDDEEE